MEEIASQPVVGAASSRALHYTFVKRLIDIGLSAVGLVVLSPVLLAIGVAIVVDSGTPVLFRCVRIGRYGRPITVFKFRTMRDGSHHHLQHLLTADEELRVEYGIRRKLRQDPRRTRVGIFLRRTSLDELPQLVNVLFGEMSLVGPRPTAPGEFDGHRESAEILQVRPGMTGLWQVNGRSERTFQERLAFDVDYVRRRSFSLDLEILIRTVGAVVSGRGAF